MDKKETTNWTGGAGGRLVNPQSPSQSVNIEKGSGGRIVTQKESKPPRPTK